MWELQDPFLKVENSSIEYIPFFRSTKLIFVLLFVHIQLKYGSFHGLILFHLYEFMLKAFYIIVLSMVWDCVKITKSFVRDE